MSLTDFSFRSGKGSYSNPYKSADEKRKFHTGTKGRRITVLANHFPMEVKQKTVFRYDVKFTFPWTAKRPLGKKDRPLCFRAIEELKKKHAKKGLQDNLPLDIDNIHTNEWKKANLQKFTTSFAMAC